MVFPFVGPPHLAVRILLSLLTWLFLRRWFAPCLRSVYRIDVSGWTALALIPLLYSLIFFTLTAGKFAARYTLPSQIFPGIPDLTIHFILLVLPTCTYFVLYHLFRALLDCYAGFRQHAELSAQVSAMDAQAQYEARLQEEYEGFLTALDADLSDIGALVQSDDLSAALALSEAAEGRISSLMKSSARHRFTDIPILDAVLSDYSAVAECDGVSLSIQFSLPSRYDFDLAALAVVLSNALENAMTACRAQPPARPKTVRLTASVVSQQFFLLLENTCDTSVEFDAEGYPIAHRPGHGYGTHSIAAFARQQDGAFQYRWRDGWFSLQLLL